MVVQPISWHSRSAVPRGGILGGVRSTGSATPVRPRRAVVVVVVGAGALAAVAAFTHPFTLRADVVVAIPLVAMLVAQIAFAVRARHRRSASGASAIPAGGRAIPAGGPLPFRRFIPWLVMFVVVVSFELFAYFEKPRQAHPTLSSLSDDLTRWQVGKAALFLAWLALGWLFLRRRSTELRGSTK
jgi:uncharacterized membrane protein YhaH (DUF805 family)